MLLVLNFWTFFIDHFDLSGNWTFFSSMILADYRLTIFWQLTWLLLLAQIFASTTFLLNWIVGFSFLWNSIFYLNVSAFLCFQLT